MSKHAGPDRMCPRPVRKRPAWSAFSGSLPAAGDPAEGATAATEWDEASDTEQRPDFSKPSPYPFYRPPPRKRPRPVAAAAASDDDSPWGPYPFFNGIVRRGEDYGHSDSEPRAPPPSLLQGRAGSPGQGRGRWIRDGQQYPAAAGGAAHALFPEWRDSVPWVPQATPQPPPGRSPYLRPPPPHRDFSRSPTAYFYRDYDPTAVAAAGAAGAAGAAPYYRGWEYDHLHTYHPHQYYRPTWRNHGWHPAAAAAAAEAKPPQREQERQPASPPPLSPLPQRLREEQSTRSAGGSGGGSAGADGVTTRSQYGDDRGTDGCCAPEDDRTSSDTAASEDLGDRYRRRRLHHEALREEAAACYYAPAPAVPLAQDSPATTDEADSGSGEEDDLHYGQGRWTQRSAAIPPDDPARVLRKAGARGDEGVKATKLVGSGSVAAGGGRDGGSEDGKRRDDSSAAVEANANLDLHTEHGDNGDGRRCRNVIICGNDHSDASGDDNVGDNASRNVSGDASGSASGNHTAHATGTTIGTADGTANGRASGRLSVPVLGAGVGQKFKTTYSAATPASASAPVPVPAPAPAGSLAFRPATRFSVSSTGTGVLSQARGAKPSGMPGLLELIRRGADAIAVSFNASSNGSAGGEASGTGGSSGNSAAGNTANTATTSSSGVTSGTAHDTKRGRLCVPLLDAGAGENFKTTHSAAALAAAASDAFTSSPRNGISFSYQARDGGEPPGAPGLPDLKRVGADAAAVSVNDGRNGNAGGEANSEASRYACDNAGGDSTTYAACNTTHKTRGSLCIPLLGAGAGGEMTPTHPGAGSAAFSPAPGNVTYSAGPGTGGKSSSKASGGKSPGLLDLIQVGADAAAAALRQTTDSSGAGAGTGWWVDGSNCLHRPPAHESEERAAGAAEARERRQAAARERGMDSGRIIMRDVQSRQEFARSRKRSRGRFVREGPLSYVSMAEIISQRRAEREKARMEGNAAEGDAMQPQA